MNSLSEHLFPDGPPTTTEFRPTRYFSAIDAMIYLREDVSYRAERVDPFLTVLWHPTEERLVGVKLKGFRFLFDRILDSLSAVLPPYVIPQLAFLPFIRALEAACTAGVGEVLTDDAAEKHRLREQKYEKARVLVKDVSISRDELPQAA